MPRFVILEHDHPLLHWDLMLEHGNALRTWRLGAPPAPGQTVRAEAIADHRIAYLDYEGPVSGDRGCVKRWDAGTFEWETETAVRIVVRMMGERCREILQLDLQEDDRWQLILPAQREQA